MNVGAVGVVRKFAAKCCRGAGSAVLALATLALTAAEPAWATPFTSTVPGVGIPLPSAYPQAGGVAIVMVGANGNIYYQFSDPTGAFVGYQNNGTPAAFRGNPFTINNPIALNCGVQNCTTYFGGSIANLYIRFSAYDGDTSSGNFDFNQISLRMNGFNVGNWSTVQTEATNNSGTTSLGTKLGFGNNTFDTGWFSSTNAALLSNILSTGSTTTQVYDNTPNDNYWDFTQGNSLTNPLLRTIAPGYTITKNANRTTFTAVGDVIGYSYVITNIGSVNISNLALTDDKIGAVACNKTTLLETTGGGPVDTAICPATGTVNYTVTQADFDAGFVTNIARATGVPEYGVLGAVTATRTVTGPTRTPAMTLTKTASPTTFGNAGTTVTYTLVAQNTGNVTLNNVAVTDPKLPTLSCTVASLAPNATRTCTGTYTVTQANVDAWATSATQLSNTATATATPASGGAALSVSATRNLTGPASAPAMTLAKTASTATYSAVGNVVNFQIAITNTGNLTFPAAPTVADPLVTGAGGSVTCPAGTVAPGATVTCTASYTITQANLDAVSLTNTASASITVAGQSAAANGSVTVTSTRSAALTISKRLASGSPTSFNTVGQTLTYEYVLTNTGNVTLNTPTVTDNKVAVTCPAGGIAPGATRICTSAAYAVTQADINAGGVTNTASGGATPQGSATPIATATPTSLTVPSVRSPALSINKIAPVVAPASFAPGFVATYSYQVANSGNTTLTQQINVTDNKIAGPIACGTPPYAPGQTISCNANYTVTAADVQAGVVVNTAFATSGTTTSPTDSKTIPQAGTPALTLSKVANTAGFNAVGNTLNYTFTVTNSGNTVIVSGQTISINDPKISGVSCAQPGVLNPGGTFTCTGTYDAVTLADLNAGKVVNTATASFSYTGPGGGTSTIISPAASATILSTAVPSMTLAKAGPVNFRTVGQVIFYTFTITNTGPITLASVTVTDPKIPLLSCTRSNIAPAGTTSCTGNYTVTQADIDAGTIANTATASATTPGGQTASATGSRTTPIAPGAGTKSMTLGKVASPTAFTAAGDVVSYTFTVTNTGTQTLTNIGILDALLPSYSCTIVSLAPGASSSACSTSYTVTQANVDAGGVTNSATATAAGAANVTASVNVTGPAANPQWTFAKLASPTTFTAAGQAVTYTFRIENIGNVTLSNISVTDPGVSLGGGCTGITLAPGAVSTACTATRTTTQADVNIGSFTNTAGLSVTPPSGGPLSDSASATITGPVENAALSVVKVEQDGSGTFGAPGTTETFTFTVTNTGNVTVQGPVLTDALTGFSCTLPNLAPGASTTTCANSTPLSTIYTITQANVDAGQLVNSVTVNGSTTQGGTPGASDSVTLSGPSQSPSISMVKTALSGAGFASVGDALTYDYVVTNTGNITLTAPISISDDKIASVSCPSVGAGVTPGATLTCTATYLVTQADIDAGSVTNNATATVTQPVTGGPAVVATSSDSATVAGAPSPAMTLDKAITGGTPNSYSIVGDAISYTFTVRNTGNTTITGPVQINDALLGAPFACVAGNLAPGSTGNCAGSYTITQADIDNGSVTNSATAFTGPSGAPTLQTAPDTATALATQTPSILVNKDTAQSAASDFFVGNFINYTFTLTNSGNVTLPGPFAVNDNFVSVSCPAGPIAPGDNIICSGSHTLTTGDIALGRVTNNATAVTSFNSNPVPSGSDTVTIPSGSNPALTMIKSELTGVPMSVVGQVLQYRFVVRNTGDTQFVSDIDVFDDKVGGPILCFDSVGGTVVLNTVASGVTPFQAVCDVNYSVTQADLDRGFVTNRAYGETIFAPAAATPVTVQSRIDTVTVAAAPAPALTVAKSVTPAVASAAVGDVLTYTITTTNAGNQTVSGVTVTDPLIPSLSCAIGGTPVTPPATLAPTEALDCTGPYTVTQADVDAQSLPNTATAEGSSPQGVLVSGTGSFVQPLAVPTPAVIVTKQIVSPLNTPTYTGPGQPVVFGVTVTNTGNVTLGSVDVTDSLVAGTCSVGTLATGASDSSCQFTYTTTQADVNAGTFGNTATATALPANPGATAIQGQGSVTTQGPVAQPALSVAKLADKSGIATVGEVVTYTYTVANAGNVTITTQPSVTDDKIGTFNCGAPPLAPRQFVQCTAPYAVTQADIDAGGVTNTATVTAPGVPMSTPVVLTIPSTRTPALTVAKVASPTTGVTAGQTIGYTYTVTNTGNVTLTAVTPDDQHTSAAGTVPLPVAGDALATDVAPTGDSTDAGADGIWDTLAPADVVTFTASYTVTQADIDAGNPITNAVTVGATGPSGTTPPSATSGASVALVPATAALEATKTVSASSGTAVGDTVDFQITVENTGNVTLTTPTLTDTLTRIGGAPIALTRGPTYVSGDAGTAAVLDVGETWVYTARATLTQADIDAGGLSNSVLASANPPSGPAVTDVSDNGNDADGNTNNDPTLLVIASAPTLEATKILTAVGTRAGDLATFDVRVENTGNVTLTGVTVADTLTRIGGGELTPDSVTFVSASASSPAGILQGGEIATYQVVYTLVQADIDAGGVQNQVLASGTPPSGPAVTDLSDNGNDGDGNTTDDVTVAAIAAGPAIEARKILTAVGTRAGDLATFDVTVENTGNVTLTGVTVADTLTRIGGGTLTPDSVTFASASASSPAGTLEVGEIATYQVVYTLVQADIDAGGVQNQVLASGTPPSGPAVTDLSDNGNDGDGNTTDDVTVAAIAAGPAIEARKILTAVGTRAGDLATFDVTVENTGNVTLTGVTVADTLTRIGGGALTPDSVAFVSASAASPEGTLQVDETATYQVVYTLVQADINAGGVQNQVLASGTPPSGPAVTDLSDNGNDTDGNTTNDVTVAAIALTPGIEATKTVTSVGSLADETVEFAVTVENTGNVTLTGVTVADTLTRVGGGALTPDSVAFISASAASPAGTLQVGETASYQVVYTLTQADVDAGGVENQVLATGTPPSGPTITDLSDNGNDTDGNATDDVTVAAVVANRAATVVKTLGTSGELFPTVVATTFLIDVANTGNVTLTNFQLADDLAGFAAPATLLSAQYPVVVRLTGLSGVTLNPGFDGVSDTGLFAAGTALAPGAAGTVEIDVTYSTASGYPAGQNIAVASSPILPVAVTGTVTLVSGDADGDGVPDGVENCGGADRDGDGICDENDYDPTGYFYCEDDGAILSGGSITVTGPTGSQSGVGSSNNITIVRDGSNGSYQFFVTAAGRYTLIPGYPAAATPSVTRLPTSAPLDVTSLGANPASLGSSENGSTGQLVDFSAAANTPSYLVFDIEAGDPHIISNNLAMTNCEGGARIQATKTADRGSARKGETVNFTLTFTNTSAISAAGATLVDTLPAGLVYTPGSATLNGAASEPTVTGNRLEWAGVNIAFGAVVTLRLSVRISSGAGFGDVINRGWLESAGGAILSNVATATVRIEPEHVFDCSDVIGKVFDDRNMNGYQDGPSGRVTDQDIFKDGKLGAAEVVRDGEPGLAGVRLVTIKGRIITTDEYGRFHVPCAELPATIGSNFTLKLDTRSLPSGYRVTTENPRTVRLTAGKLAKLNFGAAIANVVNIDLTAAAFEPGTATPKAGLEQAVAGLVRQMQATPSVVRLSYLQDREDAKTAKARMEAVEELLRDAWRGAGRYKLNVEQTIKRVQ